MRALICVFFLVFFGTCVAQNVFQSGQVDANFFRSNILLHSPDLTQLITGHPEGALISYSVKTDGNEDWESLYNYPDYGGYFLYQDFKNPILGKNYAIGVHYNFYFLKRHLMLNVAQGIAMTTNPYDKVSNPKNSAFGSKIMANIDFGLSYKKENIFNKFGIQAGFIYTHFSMGRTKSPNSGINTYGLNVGLNYNLGETKFKVIDTTNMPTMKFTEPVKLNIVFRGGVNESPIIGSGQEPFYHFGFYVDKRLNRKSAIQIGTELFLTTSFKEYLKFQAIAYPETGVTQSTDYKRLGIFIGHELFINRISVETQIGYYAYRPFKLDDVVYERVGVKYYITPKIFTGLAVKTHGFLAEALEFGIGVRL
ncbi:hypothetical protein FNO01nite_23460 [Flavobacterium noncentrifugens]|uniref:Lipid A 3-O-deacylase (PagL) n=1 Tax=Flavobacterium noncentrifugens TaxID=1128970 RepID=A0A1G9B331_9FLAO|nr:acyloxyacyl hydrolase [Flavobacterium noncentrifugens]GEP51674.1 hypothetical protein FNO01nite_23460 [Flavobacterium noncentrifugens]SDK33494.1 Lipid A 3-O-deacylase (PagL) [Flavobacterium noncentrifugens]